MSAITESLDHGHHDPGLHHQFEDMGQQTETYIVGMWTFLVSEVMFFGALFLIYTLYRWNYQLDFYIDDLALLRYAQPTVLDFAAETAVMFANAKAVAVRFQLAGVKPGDTVPVACELRRDGRVVASATTQSARGPNRIVIEPARGSLAPGMYELTARAGDGQSAPPAALRVVESPWRK